MASLENLVNLCLDSIYDDAKTITKHISKSGEEDRQRLQSILHHRILTLRLWKVPNVIDQFASQNHDIEWKVRIQNLTNNLDYTTLTFRLQSSVEIKRFKAFVRHLTYNWFEDIKVTKTYIGRLSFVVTYPSAVLLHFYPQVHQDWNEQSRFSTVKSSDVEKVCRVITCLLTEDFCLSSILSEPEAGSSSSTPPQKDEIEEIFRKQSPEYSVFRDSGNGILTVDLHYDYHTRSDLLLEQLEQAYISASDDNQTSQSEQQCEEWRQKQSSQAELEQNLLSQSGRVSQVSQESQTEFSYEQLMMENTRMKKTIEKIEEQRMILQLQNNELTEENNKMAVVVEEKEGEMQEMLSELGRVSVELTSLQNKKKRSQVFDRTYKSHTASTQTTQILSAAVSGAGISTASSQAASSSGQANRTEAGQIEGHHGAPFQMSIQESLSESVSLSNMPTSGVEGNIYNNYKLLLLAISRGLLNDDVPKLKQWVEHQFEVDVSGDVNAVFLELDRRKFISVTDLSRLRKFFEDILRYDFVCLIDSFLMGDYEQLKNSNPSGRLAFFNRGLNTQDGLTGLRSMTSPRDAPNASRDDISVIQRRFQGLPRPSSTESQTGRTSGFSQGPSRSSDSTHPPTKAPVSGPQTDPGSRAKTNTTSSRPSPVAFHPTSFPPSFGKQAVRNLGNSTSQEAVVVDGGRSEQVQDSANSSTVRGNNTNTSRNTHPGSNGHKLSKFQRPDSSGGVRTQGRASRANDNDIDNNWLCSHYKRRCYVQFECCSKFWPCHRCHNNQSTCGRRKLKSRDTKRVKCVACGQEQQFAQYCSRCNAKFARYFCGLCKHLTGTDDAPYHCEKCGICRIHGDRSFHCDVCGVCLDVQLRGNHKCREGSAHDECCICLEDAFTGCQILPCSHKVHKECATQMISSGITRCPICRESFAHKLERRHAPSKKPP